MARPIHSIAVLGAGTMGHGIAQVAAAVGYTVIIRDVCLHIAEYLHGKLGSDVFQPPEILRRMVSEGKLGKKSGEGFLQMVSRKRVKGHILHSPPEFRVQPLGC